MNAENVGAVLDALAVRFGATGAHLWAVLQRQAYVEVAMAALWVAVAGGLAFATSSLVGRGNAAAADKDAPRDAEVPWYVSGTIVGIVATIVGIIALIQLGIGITAALNPEYYALQKVLGAFK